MMFEFLLAMGQNVGWFTTFFTVVLGIILVINTAVFISTADDINDKSAKATRKVCLNVGKYFFPLFLITLFISSIPTVENLWKVRVGLIKYQLASPENLKAGVETIESIGHRLECQYLGCPEDKKKSEKEEKKD